MGARLLLRVVLPIALGGGVDGRIVVVSAASPAFVPPPPPRAPTSRLPTATTTAVAVVGRRPPAPPLLRARDRDEDGDGGLDDLPDSDDEDEGIDSSWREEGLSALSGKKLGIGNLLSFTPEQIDSIKAEARSKLDAAFDARLADINDLRAEVEAGTESSRRRENFLV